MERRPTPADSRPMSRAGKVDPSQGGAPWWAYRRPRPAEPRVREPARRGRSKQPADPEPGKTERSRSTSTAPAAVPAVRTTHVHRGGLARRSRDRSRPPPRQRQPRRVAAARGRARLRSLVRAALHAGPSGRAVAPSPAAARCCREARRRLSSLRHAHRCVRRCGRRRSLRPRRAQIGRPVDGRSEGARPSGPAADQLPEVDHRRHLLPVRPEPRRRLPAVRHDRGHRLVLLVSSAGRIRCRSSTSVSSSSS